MNQQEVERLHSNPLEMTDREKAIHWWRYQIDNNEKWDCYHMYNRVGKVPNVIQDPSQFTGRMIEEIWNVEVNDIPIKKTYGIVNANNLNLSLTPNQYSCLLQAIELLDNKTTDNTLKSKDVNVLIEQIESYYEKFNK